VQLCKLQFEKTLHANLTPDLAILQDAQGNFLTLDDIADSTKWVALNRTETADNDMTEPVPIITSEANKTTEDTHEEPQAPQTELVQEPEKTSNANLSNEIVQVSKHFT
jgi:hypothetical protein